MAISPILPWVPHAVLVGVLCYTNNVSHAQPGDLLPWYNVKMFVAACRSNRLGVLVFMVRHGFDPRQEGVQPPSRVVAAHP